MPIRLDYRDEETGVVYVCTGVVTEADLEAANEEVYQDSRLAKLRYQLVDLSRAERVEVSPEGARRLARQDTEAARKRPDLAVVVVPADDLGFGTSRIWAANVDDGEGRITPHVSRTVEQAEAWLAGVLQTDASPPRRE